MGAPRADRAAVTIESLAADNERLRAELEALRRENRALAERLVDADGQSADLVKLHVAQRRLAEATSRAEALVAIEEIIVTVVGCEEYAICEVDALGTMIVAASFGAPPSAMQPVLAPGGAVPVVVRTGKSYLPAEPATGTWPGVTACVPIRGAGVRGAIVLFALLPHRGPLDAADRALLELLGTEAARALEAGVVAPGGLASVLGHAGARA